MSALLAGVDESYLRYALAVSAISLVSFAQFRWGARVGGKLAGLPLVAVPFAAIIHVDKGASAATTATHGGAVGVVCFAVFCASYLGFLRHTRLNGALILFITLFLSIPVSGGFLYVLRPPVWAAGLVVAALTAMSVVSRRPPRRDVPNGIGPKIFALRIVTCFAMLVGLVDIASKGATFIAGIASTIPIIMTITTTTTHRVGGRDAAELLLHEAQRSALATFLCLATLSVTTALNVWLWLALAVFVVAAASPLIGVAADALSRCRRR